MLQYSPVDATFRALADPTRRAMLERLMSGPKAVSELAAPFPVSLSAIGQHVRVLEECGVVTTDKTGRVRTVRLVPSAMARADRWFQEHRASWERRFERLDAVLADMAEPDAASPSSTTNPSTSIDPNTRE